MAEVTHREPRTRFVPVAHSVFSAHRLPGVVERTARLECRAALRFDDGWDGRKRADATALPVRLIQRRKDEATQVLASLPHSPEHLYVVLVEVVFGSIVTRL
ncbi:MAG: hypothetical protein AMJ63_10430, partial [Myxococcales bacterium SG8_38_1]